MIDSDQQIKEQLQELSDIQEHERFRKNKQSRKYPDTEVISSWVPLRQLPEQPHHQTKRQSPKPIPIILRKSRLNLPTLPKPAARFLNSSLQLKPRVYQEVPTNSSTIIKVSKIVPKQVKLHPILIQLPNGESRHPQALSCSLRSSNLNGSSEYLRKIQEKITNASKLRRLQERASGPLIQPPKAKFNSFISRLFRTKRIKQSYDQQNGFSGIIPAPFSDAHIEGEWPKYSDEQTFHNRHFEQNKNRLQKRPKRLQYI